MTYAMARTRVVLVLLMTLGLGLGSMVAPAGATTSDDGSDNLETVRAQTINTIDYKIGLLTDLKNGTANADRKAVYDDGIAELRALREQAAIEDSVDALRAMDARAHDIYYETKARAAAVGQTEEEKVAEARKAALDTINYKLSFFSDALVKAENPDHKRIYEGAVASLRELQAAAETTTSVHHLLELKARAHEIYDATKRTIAETGESDKVDPPKDEAKTEAEQAAEAVANARRSTLRLIEYKVSIFTHAAEAAKNPTVAGVYVEAAAAVFALTDDAKAAKTTKALRSIDAQVMAIYEATKQAITDGHDQPDWQPSESLIAHVQALGSVIERLVGVAEATADLSPDTAKAVAKAGANVAREIEGVEKAAETGNRLDVLWEDLRQATNEFRRALAAHVVAITDAPDCINGWHLPG